METGRDEQKGGRQRWEKQGEGQIYPSVFVFNKAGIVCFLNTVQVTMFERLSLTGSGQAEEEHRKSERRKQAELSRKGETEIGKTRGGTGPSFGNVLPH
jgi:hypothetical protein